MKTLKLIKGLSYTTKGFSCKAGSPFDIDDEKAAALLATGRFEEIPVAMGDGVPFAMNDDDPNGAVLSADAVADMTKAELAELAKAKDIDISECRNKADIVNRINGALGLASLVQMGMES